jgi:Flp pilus assembly protein TadG
VWRILNWLRPAEGQSLVALAMFMTALLGMAAVSIDIGVLYVEQQHLQNSVDVAALAAGQDMPDTTLATTTANSYVQRNAPNATAVVTFPDSQTVSIKATRTVNFMFAKVLGLTSTTIQAAGSGTAGRIGEALDYTLFSGSTTVPLTLNGSNQYIGGNVHTNKNWDSNGSQLTITGALEAVTSILTNGSQINIAQRIQNAPFVPMPDFSETIKAKAQAAGTYFVGNKTYSSSQITVDSPIYIQGNLTINGSRFTGRGTIVATGSITFNGSSQRVNATDALAFYSKTGNITLNGSNVTIDGIVYAPNGNIDFNGSNQTIHGRVIGNTVTFNGSQLNLSSSNNDLAALPSTGVKLVH